MKEQIYAIIASTEARQNILERNSGFHESRVFVANDKGITAKILRQTSGKGMDVLLSCSTTNPCHTYWECLAPFGRVIDISGDDQMDTPSISMSSLPRGAIFTSFDLELLNQFQPAAISRYVTSK